MSPTSIVERIFGARSRVRVLRALYRSDVPLNSSQVARRAELSQPAVTTALGELADYGLVKMSSAGRANVHWLVRDNIYVEQLVKLAFEFESALPDMIEDDLRGMFESVAESVVLFGSHARGDEDIGSDVDVVVVVKDAEAKQHAERMLVEDAGEFSRRWGRSLSVIVYDAQEAAALASRAPAFYGSLLEEGARILGLLPFEWEAAWGSEEQ